MAESKLQRDFKERDVQRMRNIITKDYGAKTATQVGYTTDYIEHKEGDIWEEQGKKWTIKNGLKQTVTRFDELKKSLSMPLCCPKCLQPMVKGKIDKYMYSIHKVCSDCVIENETNLKRDGKFEEYEKNIQQQGIRAHIKEMEDVLLEIMLNNDEESFITEAGDIETWKGKGVDKQRISKDIQEYIQKLKDTAEA
jgi:hypothetical protein